MIAPAAISVLTDIIVRDNLEKALAPPPTISKHQVPSTIPSEDPFTSTLCLLELPKFKRLINMSEGIKIIFGAANFGNNPVEKNEDFLDQLQNAHVTHLDTARLYAGSEKMLSILGAPSRFVIDSKVNGFAPNTLKRGAIMESAEKSFEDLGISSVGISNITSEICLK